MKNASKRVDKRAAILCAYLIHQVISNQRTAKEQPKNSTSSSGVAPIPDGICPAISWAFFAFDEREIREANYGLLSVVLAPLITYPFSMNYAHRAASFVARRLSHEAIIATFAGLIVVVSVWEGQLPGFLVIVTIGLLRGLLSRRFGLNTGVQFMECYAAVPSVPALTKLIA
ncbi:MAG: putative tricarboxylic transport rane protein [Caballeronia sp.]|jgi:hypothetical protein|nr:putative tricarboxylic transport rane protein [Caballeronia sp.]